MSDGYAGYTFGKDGTPIEIYDHRDEFVPSQPVVEKPRDKGCSSPTGSIVSFVFIFIGTVLWCVCGVIGMHMTTQLFEDYGPSEGNPATDPPPEWIPIGSVLYSEWRLVDPDKPGNYYPMVTRWLEYCMYAIAPLTVLVALIMLCDGYNSVQEFQSRKGGCKSSSPGICCSSFLVGIAWFSVIVWTLFIGFNALGVYYYRIVQERCYDRYERTLDIGVYPYICIDLMQLGLVRMKNTNNQAYGKICGESQIRLASYGQLEEYCVGYKTPYAMMICAMSGAGLILIGFMQFGMTLVANYSLLQKKYSRPLRTQYRRLAC